MKFLVSGANGFVGKQLCEKLLRQGHIVRAAVRSRAQLPDGVEASSVGNIDGNTHWEESLCGVDAVIHLAARVHMMKESAVDPLKEFLDVNLHGTVNLAQQAVHASVKRFVFVSSIKVNGEGSVDGHSYSEQDTPAPHDPYADSKWQAEQALRQVAQDTSMRTVILRPPLIYGPNVKGNFINLLAAINKGIPLPLAGARNKRSLVYVGNLISALVACSVHPAAAGQTYLVRDGEDVSTAQLAEKIAVALRCSNRLFYLPPGLLRAVGSALGRSAQVDRLLGSLRVNDAKLRSELGWSAPYTLEQGLRETAAWYVGQRHG